MSTRHLVDPELLAALDDFMDITLSAGAMPAVRAGFAEAYDQTEPLDDPDVTAGAASATSADGHTVPLLVYRPRGASSGLRPAVLHIHGGGYVIGSAAMSALSNVGTAKALDAVVISVDYRLAPEHPHPAPVEDCYAALQWLHANAGALGVDAARIAVKGESAGGGLAAALALLARDRNGPAICHQHLIYPMLDDRTCIRAENPATGEFVWNRASNHFGWASLLGTAPGADGISPHAAPARAENLAGLPPAFIYVGALDLFVDEDITYAQRLIAAGVACEFHIFPGAYHGFEMSVEADVTQRAGAASMAALSRALA